MRSCIGNNIDYSGNCVAPTETKADIESYAAEKMDIVDDFLVGRRKLKANEKRELEAHLCSLKSTRAIDTYFRDFINARM